MNRKKLLATIFLGSLLVSNLSMTAQESGGSTRRKADLADQYFSTENYWEALPLYKALADAEPQNVKYNNRAGICYYFSSHKTKCIPYFEAAVKNWGRDTIIETYYYLGTAYQMENKFDKAIAAFTVLKTIVKPVNGTSTLNDVDRSIEMCNNGKKYVQDPTSVRIFNLGSSINSVNPDYAPVISADESKIIFTSKRKEGTGSATTPDGFYYEDIYIADKLSEGWQVQNLDTTAKAPRKSLFYIFWSKARKIGSSINTKDHDAAISLSPDGKTLFVYRDNFIYESKFDGKNWGKPEKLNDNVNEKRSFQPSCSMTNDGKLLFLVSDRPGGSGGKDIYVSTKQTNGQWGPCANLSEVVNTEYDEDSPFITADGKTLYFSSQGHNSMGGYDIFKSENVNGKWEKPQNLGYPTNTGADDVFFVMNSTQSRAYLSSIKDDTYGDYDIYVLSFVPETYLYAAVKQGDQLTAINTIVKSRGSKTQGDTSTYSVSREVGHHKLALLAPDAYNLSVEAPGFKPHSVDVKVPAQNFKKPFYNEVHFEIIKRADGVPLKQITTFYTAFFDVDSVVNSDPKLSQIQNRKQAYSAMVKAIDTNTTKLNFKVYTFTDILFKEIAKVDTAIFASKGTTKEATVTTPTVTTATGTTTAVTTTATGVAATSTSTVNAATSTGTTATATGTTATSITTTTAVSTTTPGKTTTTATTTTTPKGTTTTINTATAATSTAGTTTAEVTADIRNFDPILFDFSKALVREEVKAELDDIFKYLQENKDYKMEVIGHTDSKGTDQINNTLSTKRAKATVAYFTAKGIKASRLKAIGLGENRPVVPNENPDKSDNPDGRQKNRRVEFKIVAAKK